MKGGNPLSLMGYWLTSVPLADQQKTTFLKQKNDLLWHGIKFLSHSHSWTKEEQKCENRVPHHPNECVCSCVSHVAVFSVTCLLQCRTLTLYLMDLWNDYELLAHGPQSEGKQEEFESIRQKEGGRGSRRRWERVSRAKQKKNKQMPPFTAKRWQRKRRRKKQESEVCVFDEDWGVFVVAGCCWHSAYTSPFFCFFQEYYLKMEGEKKPQQALELVEPEWKKVMKTMKGLVRGEGWGHIK